MKKQKGSSPKRHLLTPGHPRISNVLYFPPAKIQDKLKHRNGTRSDEERKKGKAVVNSNWKTALRQGGVELGGVNVLYLPLLASVLFSLSHLFTQH